MGDDVLCLTRGDAEVAHGGHELGRIVVLIGANRFAPIRQGCSIAGAASGSAASVACVNRVSTASPCLFSISRCPHRPAWLPDRRTYPPATNLGRWLRRVARLSLSRRKLRSPLRAEPGGSSLLSLGRKLFMLAQAWISVPSTEMPFGNKAVTAGRFSTASIKAAAMSPST